MNTLEEQKTCRRNCWLLAGLIGLVTAVLLMWMGSWGFVSAVFAGIVVAIILGALLSWIICVGSTQAQGAAALGAGAATAGAVARHAVEDDPTEDATAAADAADNGANAAGDVAEELPEAAADAVDTVSDAAEEPVDAASEVMSDASIEAEAGETASPIKPSAALAGEEELASRKGAWKYEKPADDAGHVDGANTATSDGAGVEASAAASAANNGQDAAPAVSEEVAAKLVAGENVDLTDYDGDGVSEGTGEGTRPEALAAPRAGGADDLKQIKGVGPKLEQLLHSLGFFHFDQVAGWTADEVAWVDANLKGFKGRVSRDNWVAQAKVLAAGGETEFSKRVEDGDVY